MKISPGLLIFLIGTCSLGLNCKWPSRDESVREQSAQTDSSIVPEEFESEAKAYENPDRVIWQKPDLVIEQLGNVQGKVVADLGAGTGYFSRRIAYKGARVIAIDIDPHAIRWMEDQRAKFPPELQKRLEIRQAAPDDPHLRAGEVDIVLLVNTYSFIEDRINYFIRLKNAIKTGGQIVIIDFKKQDTPFGPPVEERVDDADVEKELEAAGYTILKSDKESLQYQYIIKAGRP